MRCLVVVLSLCFISAAYADKVVSGIQNIGAQQSKSVAKFGVLPVKSVDCQYSLQIKDAKKASQDCSSAWYEVSVDCFGPVQFKGVSDCSKPESVESIKDGKKVVFTSGHVVNITKGKNKIVVDYDR